MVFEKNNMFTIPSSEMKFNHIYSLKELIRGLDEDFENYGW